MANHLIARTDIVQKRLKDMGESYDKDDNFLKARYKFWKKHPKSLAGIAAYTAGMGALNVHALKSLAKQI